jgi:hypothetical protein
MKTDKEKRMIEDLTKIEMAEYIIRHTFPYVYDEAPYECETWKRRIKEDLDAWIKHLQSKTMDVGE